MTFNELAVAEARNRHELAIAEARNREASQREKDKQANRLITQKATRLVTMVWFDYLEIPPATVTIEYSLLPADDNGLQHLQITASWAFEGYHYRMLDDLTFQGDLVTNFTHFDPTTTAESRQVDIQLADKSWKTVARTDSVSDSEFPDRRTILANIGDALLTDEALQKI